MSARTQVGAAGVLRLLGYRAESDPHAAGPEIVLAMDGAPPDATRTGSHKAEDLELGDYECKLIPAGGAEPGLWLLEWPWTLIPLAEASGDPRDGQYDNGEVITTARYGDGAWRRPTVAELVELGALADAQPGAGLTFEAFSRENRARCEAPDGFNHAIDSWSLSDWMTATLGELGEAANVAKKLNRVRDGIPGNTRTESELRADLAAELADAFIYLDLLAQSQGIALADAVRAAFDAKSAKLGYVARGATPAGEVAGV